MKVRIFIFVLFLSLVAGLTGMPCGWNDILAQPDKEKKENNFTHSDSSKIHDIVYKEGKGFIAFDRKRNALFEVFPFDNGPDYPSEGVFRILENGKIGYADEMGNVVIKPQFEAALPFSDGMAAFCLGCSNEAAGEHKIWTGGKWGFINHTGRVTVPAKYDRVMACFENGIAKVEYLGSVISINKKGEQVIMHNEWIGLLGRAARLTAKLFFGESVKVDLSWHSNDTFIFSAKDGLEYLCIKITNNEKKELLQYDVIPWQSFTIKPRVDLSEKGISGEELVVVTDYAVIYSFIKPGTLDGNDIKQAGKFKKLFEPLLEINKNHRLQEEVLHFPENVRIISNRAYDYYVDLQIALPGTVMPADSEWMNICEGRMLYLQLVPDMGEIKKRWIKTADLPVDPYYTAVEDGLLKYFGEALDETSDSPALRNEIFNRTKSKIRKLFSGPNSYVKSLSDKYEERLKRWLFVKETAPLYPTEENMFGDYRPKRTPDTVVDYMPSLSADIKNLPHAELENYSDLLRLLQFYSENAKSNPGNWEEGNMILGGKPREYRPSKDELLASETGDRLAHIINTHPKEKIIEFLNREGSIPTDVEYTRYTFTHADVMGSGRFFYVQTSEKIKLSLEKDDHVF